MQQIPTHGWMGVNAVDVCEDSHKAVDSTHYHNQFCMDLHSHIYIYTLKCKPAKLIVSSSLLEYYLHQQEIHYPRVLEVLILQ